LYSNFDWQWSRYPYAIPSYRQQFVIDFFVECLNYLENYSKELAAHGNNWTARSLNKEGRLPSAVYISYR
jgi:hypothetical protein